MTAFLFAYYMVMVPKRYMNQHFENYGIEISLKHVTKDKWAFCIDLEFLRFLNCLRSIGRFLYAKMNHS